MKGKNEYSIKFSPDISANLYNKYTLYLSFCLTFRYSLSSELFFKLSQPLLCILNLSNTRVSVFPKLEEVLVILYGPGFFA